jgi:hypothetical protein
VTVPTPVRDSLSCESEAVLENDRDPDTVPLPCGVKATPNDMLCPAAIVKGNEAPVKTYWELLLEAEETVTLAPVALTVIGKVSVVPTGTLL